MPREEQFERSKRRAEAFIALAWATGAQTGPGTGEFDDWNTYACATVARSAYLFESVIGLANRPLDAEILARSLFDQVLVFAWIAIDPPVHLRRWVAADLKSRAALVSHAQKFGLPGLPADVATDFETRRENVAAMPNLVEMARAADRHWLPIFGGIFSGLSSLEAMYAVSFRGYSASVHPTAQALGPFLRRVAPGRVTVGRPVFEVRRSPLDPCTLATTFLLLIAMEKLGRPQPRDIHEIWLREPAAPITE